MKKMYEQTKGYLFGYLTILDFLFYEVSFSLTHLCNIPNAESHPIFQYRKFF